MFEVKIKQGQGQKSWPCINSALKDFELQAKEEIVFTQRLFMRDAYVLFLITDVLIHNSSHSTASVSSVCSGYRNVAERNSVKCVYLVHSGLCLRCFVRPPPTCK